VIERTLDSNRATPLIAGRIRETQPGAWSATAGANRTMRVCVLKATGAMIVRECGRRPGTSCGTSATASSRSKRGTRSGEGR
jgi:hypothetical protein